MENKQNKAYIGLDKFHYAIMLDEETETYDTPVHIPGVIQVGVSPIVNNVNLAADNKIFDTADSMQGANVTVNLSNIPTADRAAILGHKIDERGGLVERGRDEAPYLAIGYRRKLSGGNYRYVWIYKGKFRPYDETADTQAETLTFQTPSISATFMPRNKDDEWRYSVKEGDEGVSKEYLKTWFDEVQEPLLEEELPEEE